MKTVARQRVAGRAQVDLGDDRLDVTAGHLRELRPTGRRLVRPRHLPCRRDMAERGDQRAARSCQCTLGSDVDSMY